MEIFPAAKKSSLGTLPFTAGGYGLCSQSNYRGKPLAPPISDKRGIDSCWAEHWPREGQCQFLLQRLNPWNQAILIQTLSGCRHSPEQTGRLELDLEELNVKG